MIPTTSQHRGRYQLRNARLPNGERFNLLCVDGLPLYLPAAFALHQREINRAPSTIGFKLRIIGHFFVWCDDHGVNWEERFQSGQFFTNAEIAAIKVWMRLPMALNPRKRTAQNRTTQLRIAPAIHTTRMLFLGQFLKWYGTRITYSVQGSRHPFLDENFQDFLIRWNEIRPKDTTDPKPMGNRWGLSPEQCDLFLEIIHPDNPRNPFESGMRIRNYALMILLFDHGLRIAESLMLRVDDLDFRNRTFCLAERRQDPYEFRGRVPSPKLQHHRSAAPRLIIMTPRTSQALIQWLDNDRRDKKRFPGALKSPFVFVSERVDPERKQVNALSLRRVNSLFGILKEAFPALGLRFCPHVLRHTFVERYFEAHPQMTPQDRDALCWMTGWVPTTVMFSRYAKRGICERAGKATLALAETRQAATKRQLLEDDWDSDTMPL